MRGEGAGKGKGKGTARARAAQKPGQCTASAPGSSGCRHTRPTTTTPQLIYNIDPLLGALVPPPKPIHHQDPIPAARGPRSEPAQIAKAPVVQESRVELTQMAAAQAVREPLAEPARRGDGAPQRGRA